LSKYEELANKLRNGIINDTYPAGCMLPSENELVIQEGLSRQTVRQAFNILESEGRIQRRRGSGTIVTSIGQKREITHNIAIITTYIGEYIFPDILRGIVTELGSKGYTPSLSATHNHIDNERAILLSLLAKPIDGIIIEGTKTALPNPNIDLFKSMKAAGIPIVFVNGYYPEYRPDVFVIADDRTGGIEATQYLIKKGHKKIAGIFKSDDIQGHLRYAGYIETLLNANMPISDNNVLWYTTDTKEKIIAASLIETLEDCDAVVCYNDEIAMKVLNILKENKVAVPEQIAVIGFDGSIFCSMSTPQLTSMNLEKEEIGRTAARKLLRMIHGSKEKPCLLSWTLEEREST